MPKNNDMASNVTMIPALSPAELKQSKYKQIRVAAYCRVSTDSEEQANSYQVQIEYYTNLINSNPEWTLAGIFADEEPQAVQQDDTQVSAEENRPCAVQVDKPFCPKYCGLP